MSAAVEKKAAVNVQEEKATPMSAVVEKEKAAVRAATDDAQVAVTREEQAATVSAEEEKAAVFQQAEQAAVPKEPTLHESAAQELAAARGTSHNARNLPREERGPEVTISQVASQQTRSTKKRSREPVEDHP